MTPQEKDIFLNALDDARYRLKKAEERLRELELMFGALIQSEKDQKNLSTDQPVSETYSRSLPNEPEFRQRSPLQAHIRKNIKDAEGR